jgi:dTDP-4-dehydrorhamnose 3,5-epimerase
MIYMKGLVLIRCCANIMKFKENILNGSFLIDIDKNEDNRGFFARLFCEREFSQNNLETNWKQINTSHSVEKRTLRGLHFQRPPNAEVKLVRCIHGAIWDVIVDLRHSSPTFGKWFGSELNDLNRLMMYVPQGFAHGFLTLSSDTEILYLVSEYYSPESEDTLRWNDPQVNIVWPKAPLIISEKDENSSLLNELTPILI